MEKSLKIGLLCLALSVIGLIITVYFCFPPPNNDNLRAKVGLVHSYDYILEVSNYDGTERYTLYNEEHVLIADS